MNPRPPLRLLADTEWLREPPPPQLVDGLLPAGALAALVGAPGTGKTFVAMSLSTAIGIAADWLGHRITAAGPVIYAVGEGHTAFPRRLRAVRTAHGLQEDEPSGVFYGREPLSLLDSSDVTCLLDSVREHLQGEAPRLLVFDPLAAFMGGGDENSTQDMSTVVASLNRIRTDTDAAVLVTHHTGWNPDRERGSTALRGALDVLYSVKLEDNVITLECVKMRDGNPPEPLHLTLRPAGDSCVVVAASASAITPASLSSRQQHALTALREIVVDEGVSYSRWKEASHLAPATFDRAVPVLVRGLHVMKTGRGRSARYVPADVALTITSPSFHPHEGDPRSPSSPSHPFRGDGVMARVESAETERLPGQGDAFEGSL